MWLLGNGLMAVEYAKLSSCVDDVGRHSGHEVAHFPLCTARCQLFRGLKTKWRKMPVAKFTCHSRQNFAAQNWPQSRLATSRFVSSSSSRGSFKRASLWLSQVVHTHNLCIISLATLPRFLGKVLSGEAAQKTKVSYKIFSVFLSKKQKLSLTQQKKKTTATWRHLGLAGYKLPTARWWLSEITKRGCWVVWGRGREMRV